MKHQHIYDLCKQHMHSYVLAETEDGNKFDGILTGLDEEYAYFAVPLEATPGQMGHQDYAHQMAADPYQGQHNNYYGGMYGNMPYSHANTGYDTNYYHRADEQIEGQQENRQFFGYPGYGWGYPGYGYGYPPRRFRRLVLPLAALVALTALPWY